jgi:shikimate kinase
MQVRCALVGMPGSGKSTVGKQLAQRLGVPFIDLDHQLELVLKTSIRNFFETEGEARFRDLEAQVLADTTAQPGGMVLSTGGGAVLRPENREVLRQFGNVLYLRASPEEIFKRVKHDRTRPLLQVGNPLHRLRELYAQRDTLYRDTATYVIETGRPTVHTLVNMIMMQLEMAQGAQEPQVPHSTPDAPTPPDMPHADGT